MAKATRENINMDRLPNHIAIIMDGNGRWAKKRLMPRKMGHRAGMASLKKIVKACDELGIAILTVFAFSTENWKRPRDEVDYLMQLLIEFLHKELNELHSKNVRISVLGDCTAIPVDCQKEIEQAVELTKNNTGLSFNLALNYGARHEIIEAAKNLALKVKSGELAVDELNEEMFSGLLYTGGMSDPDLLIRTAGEMRVSNFMLWQIAYSELVVTDTLWPDFTAQDLKLAIAEYQKRDRKFGGLIN